VKISRSDDDEKMGSFRQEYEITKDLNHQNLVKTIEFFED
jgi:serine/threonine protein kinase